MEREKQSMLGILIAVGVAGALIAGLIYVVSRPDRYATMTDQEFEEETKKGPGLGEAIVGFERALRRKQVDYVIEQKYRVERDAAGIGGEPPEETATRMADRTEAKE
jgi:hypothetical protein